ASLQAYLGQTEITRELMEATLNLASAKKIDLAAAAELVGKSIGTSTNALARQGIEIDTNATKSEKLAQVVGALNDKYAGFAVEPAAERLCPFVVQAAQSVPPRANRILDSQSAWQWFEFAVQTVARVLSGLKLQAMILGQALINPFVAIGQAIARVVQGDFNGA